MADFLEESGEVIKAEAGMATIKLKRHSSCDKCGACGMGNKPELIMEVQDGLGVSKGDIVLLRMQAGHLFKAAFLMYTIPLTVLILGFLAGQRIGLWMGMNINTAENFGILSGFLCLTLSYFAIRWWDRRHQLGVKMQPEIVKIIYSAQTHLEPKLK